jgi:hypothetical protein
MDPKKRSLASGLFNSQKSLENFGTSRTDCFISMGITKVDSRQHKRTAESSPDPVVNEEAGPRTHLDGDSSAGHAGIQRLDDVVVLFLQRGAETNQRERLRLLKNVSMNQRYCGGRATWPDWRHHPYSCVEVQVRLTYFRGASAYEKASRTF